jgi:hypothetical protein
MEDVRNKIYKANGAFNQLQKVWKSSGISLKTKLRIFNSSGINVKSILSYGCTTWRVTQEMCRKSQSFVNRCPCRIVKVRQTVIITIDELWKQTNEIQM